MEQCDAKTTYMSEHGTKIAELFGRDEMEDCVAWQTEVLEELIAENETGFFVTDLQKLQELTTNLFRQAQSGKTDFIAYFQKIIALSMVPFRKISNGDDRRCFHHIGGFFESLCPNVKLDHPDLQLEAARAISWFSNNCGPLNVSETSTFKKFQDKKRKDRRTDEEKEADAEAKKTTVRNFGERRKAAMEQKKLRDQRKKFLFPSNDDPSLYSFIPTSLRADSVIKVFVETFTEVLQALPERDCNGDVLALCFRALFEFVKRNLSSAIPASFVNVILDFIVNQSEIKITASAPSKPNQAPPCSTRVMAAALLFLDAYIQESKEAMQICGSQTFVSTVWSLFVNLLFHSYKNVQKRIRNEFLGIVMLIVRAVDVKQLEPAIVNKMFDLLQSVALLVPDVAMSVSYSTKTRELRLTHEPVDIEIIILAQDLTLILNQKTELPDAKPVYIEHQINVLRGDLNKYLMKSRGDLVIQALQLLRAFVRDVKHFVQCEGPEVLMQMMIDPIEDVTLFYVLILVLGLFPVFKDSIFVEAVMKLPRENEKILTLILSLMAVLMQDTPEIVETFMELEGLELLKECFNSNSVEIVLSAIDCARSIAPTVFTNIDQRLVFMLLDCSDSAPTLIRYAFVGLFLDLIQYEAFVTAAVLWKSLKTNANIQRTIVKWWREEEERLDIKYDKGIVIDIDKPLEGHPLVAQSLKKVIEDKGWLLDKHALCQRNAPYKLDFRARLFLLLKPFPEMADEDCKATDKIKEVMIRDFDRLKCGGVWRELRDQLSGEEIKPLHDDKARVAKKLEKMRDLSANIQERQCDIWQKCESDRIAVEQRTYNQLNEGLKTAQYVAENYKAIMSSQPVAVARPYQGRTVKGEDVLVRAGNLRTQQKAEMSARSIDVSGADAAAQRDTELEEIYISDCLQDESISYLVQLMKASQEEKAADEVAPIVEESIAEEE